MGTPRQTRREWTPHPSAEPIPRRLDRRPAPLSFAQQRLWFLDRLVPNSPFYNLSNIVRLPYVPNVAVLEASLQEIVRRHESLRTRFTLVDGDPVQHVETSWNLPLHLVDLSALSGDQQRAEVGRLANHEARAPFDLGTGPLLRASLLQLGAQESVLMTTMHHIVSDGWSHGIFFRELNAVFEAFAAGRPSPLPELSIQYADFATWQREWLTGDTKDAQVGYWKRQLADLTVLDLPTDRPRSAVQTFRGEYLELSCSDSLGTALKELSRQHGVTLFMTLLAAFKVLLYKYTGQTDIAAGSPIAGRNRTELEPLIGFFVNTLVLRTRVSGDLTFADLLRQVHRTALEGYAHQDLPFEMLVEELHPKRDLSRNPLFQVMFQLLNAQSTAQSDGVPEEQQIDVSIGTSKFDLTLSMTDAGHHITGTLEYNTDLFDRRTAVGLIEHYRNILKAVSARPGACIGEIPLLTTVEQDRIVVGWNARDREYPSRCSIHHLFEEHAAARSNEVALRFDGTTTTYGSLNCAANRLSHHLMRLGVAPGEIVGIYLDRSAEMIVAILGVLKAGAAYLPFDPTCPPQRLATTIADAGVRAVVTSSDVAARLPGGGAVIVALDADAGTLARMSADNPGVAGGPDSLAYLIYTSGSTGIPKGIMVPHRAIARLVRNTDYVHIAPGDRVAHASACSFDAATFEIWGALLNGAEVVGFSKETTIAPHEFAARLRAQRIDVLFLTTALFNQIAQTDPGAFSSVRDVLFGGELVDPRSVRDVMLDRPPRRLLHVYGPTENTTFSSWFLVENVDRAAATVPIGYPIANTTAYVLDRDLMPVPAGIPGELCVGGDGLAHGYIGRPALTAERFIPNPFTDAPGQRLYRTGDYARWQDDGTIEFIGRRDDQIKLRGFRIELGDIQSALEGHPAIRQAAVTIHEPVPGDRRIVAHVTLGSDRSVTPDALRAFLRDRLPDYMIPASFALLESLPLTVNGKVDREALVRTFVASTGTEEHAPPETRLEQIVTTIWQRVLGLEHIGVDQNFFDLGGHSLLIARVFNALRDVIGGEFGMIDLFRYPTIRTLARHLESIEPVRVPPADNEPAVVPAHAGDALTDRIARQRLMMQRRAATVRNQRK